MPFRTYVPALMFIAKRLCRYITRYQAQINANLTTSEQRVALAALLTACEVFEGLVAADVLGD